MIGGIGGYGAAMSRAAYQSYNVRQDLNETLGNISAGTATNFRRNAVNAGISNTVKSQLVGWQNADRVNTQSLSKLDMFASIMAERKSLFDESTRLVYAASDETLDQEARNNYRDELLSIYDRMSDLSSNYLDAFGGRTTVDVNGTPTEISSLQRLAVAMGDGSDDYHLNYFKLNDPISHIDFYLDADTDTSALVFDNIEFVQGLLADMGATVHTEHSEMPVGYDQMFTYLHADNVIPFAQVQAAQDHVERMSSVLEGAVSKLNALDYEAEVTRMRKLQQQETQAMSAMQIANQGMQTYVQALANTNAGIGRLVRGAF